MASREEIQRRTKACYKSIKHYDEQHRDFVSRSFVNLEYVQAECSHPVVKQDTNDPKVNYCFDCGKVL